MLRMIHNELCRAAKTVGNGQAAALAPIYLCACDLHADTLNDAGEMLLHSLEQDDIFDPLQDASVLLTVTAEEHVSENEMRRIGFSDRFGQYRHSVSGWLKYLSATLHITTGILLIRAESLSAIRSNPDWWNIQLQCMESHKNSFIFIIMCSPKNLSALEEIVSLRCQCRTVETQSVSPEAYADIFASAVQPYHLTLSPEAHALVTNTVKECSESVSILQIIQWARTAAWQYLTGTDAPENGTLNAADLDADAFKQKNSLSAAPRKAQRIGY